MFSISFIHTHKAVTTFTNTSHTTITLLQLNLYKQWHSNISLPHSVFSFRQTTMNLSFFSFLHWSLVGPSSRTPPSSHHFLPEYLIISIFLPTFLSIEHFQNFTFLAFSYLFLNSSLSTYYLHFYRQIWLGTIPI